MTKSNRERLQLFVELACYSDMPDEPFICVDPADPQNRERAEKWMSSELTFLAGRDRDELVQVWENVIDDPRDSRMLFTVVKMLQSKYSNENK